jgi:hypothetical protein
MFVALAAKIATPPGKTPCMGSGMEPSRSSYTATLKPMQFDAVFYFLD